MFGLVICQLEDTKKKTVQIYGTQSHRGDSQEWHRRPASITSTLTYDSFFHSFKDFFHCLDLYQALDVQLLAGNGRRQWRVQKWFRLEISDSLFDNRKKGRRQADCAYPDATSPTFKAQVKEALLLSRFNRMGSQKVAILIRLKAARWVEGAMAHHRLTASSERQTHTGNVR